MAWDHDLDLDLVIVLLYTNVPNMGPFLFFSGKGNPFFSPDFGLWRTLEVPNWSLAS